MGGVQPDQPYEVNDLSANKPTAASVADSPLREPVKYLAILAQLALISLLARRFDLETPVFQEILILSTVGFAVHAGLPMRWRQPFFLLLSVFGIVWVFGFQPDGLRHSAWLFGIGLALLGICHLPLSFWVRVGLLLLVGGGIALVRNGKFTSPVPNAVWPILGSMFMFRLATYMYDTKHDRTLAGFGRSVSYFFLLPNICFPLFPVIDFKTYVRNYYKGDAYQGYQRGVVWIARGCIQLIFYRWVYREFLVSLEEVTGLLSLGHFMLATYLLYLNVSGTFHIIIGLLNLFGYFLPETHHLYYLASSFNDYWRRINIYWKDFMMKIFYYPAFFRLKKLGPMVAMVLATMVVFLMTWFLHSYQWFWLRGKFPVRMQDGIFWGALGLVVVVNALWEAKKGRQRSLKKKTMSFVGALRLCLRTVATFTTICVLWSIWNSSSVSSWTHAVDTALRAAADDWKGWLAAPAFWWGTVALAATVCAVAWLVARKGDELARGVPGLRFGPSAGLTLATLIVLLGVVHDPIRKGIFPAGMSLAMAELTERKLNKHDLEQMERGYYEDLLDVNSFNPELWNVLQKQPADWRKLDLRRNTRDFLGWELLPGATGDFKGEALTTNQFGFRDQEYAREKPEGTYRIAMLGSSYVMGSGVADGICFEAQLEQRLNAGNTGGGPYDHYEILNCAVGGYSVPQQLQVLQQKALPLEPDAIFFIAHANDGRRTVTHLVNMVTQGYEIPFPFLQDALREAGVDSFSEVREAELALQPVAGRLLIWLYGELGRMCRERGVLPVFLFLPRIKEFAEPEAVERQIRWAEDAGFLTINLDGIWENQFLEGLWVAEYDLHPNDPGHKLITEWMYQGLLENAAVSQALGLFGHGK